MERIGSLASINEIQLALGRKRQLASCVPLDGAQARGQDL
jgi:hypothetical protein